MFACKCLPRKKVETFAQPLKLRKYLSSCIHDHEEAVSYGLTLPLSRMPALLPLQGLHCVAVLPALFPPEALHMLRDVGDKKLGP